MKITGLAIILLTALALNVMGETEWEKRWLERKEALRNDKSVMRHYTFEDVKDSQSMIKDISGNGADLKFIPRKVAQKEILDLQVVEGRIPGKKAVRLDRGYYQGPVVDIDKGAFTVECWFRRKGKATVYPELKASANTLLLCGGGPTGWSLFPAVPPDNLIARISCLPGTTSDGKKTGSLSARASGVSVPHDKWNHAAFTWDGKEIFLYFNGVLVGRIKHDGKYVPAKGPLMVGYSDGEVIDIDEVVIYSRVLNSEEIKQAGAGQEEAAGERIKSIFSAADRFIEKGDFTKARKEYEEFKNILGIDYGIQLYLFNTAESYRIEKNYREAHGTYDSLLKLPGLSLNYRVCGLFGKAALYSEQKEYRREREVYTGILKINGLSGNDSMRARRATGDTYTSERQYNKARDIYEALMRETAIANNPNEMHRLELADRLEFIDNLKDGEEIVPARERRASRVKLPKYSIYVSPSGSDNGDGSLHNPFATLRRVQEEVRRVIREKGLPGKGIVVFMREGRYFMEDTISFGSEDSGTEESPVVYRSYPGEEVRIIGGKTVNNFKPVDAPDILRRLPAESRDRVRVADLKELGITEYGQLRNRGFGTPQPGAMEVIYNGNVMQMARYPNDGWLRVAALVNPAGDYIFRNTPYQKGKFIYSGSRPERWTDEDDAWLKGYLGPMVPYVVKHAKITSIDTKGKVINVAEDPRTANIKDPAYVGSRISKGEPYFAYNLLSEIDMPGEYYIDRKNGKLYLWPPGEGNNNEIIVTTLDKPLVEFKNASHMVLYRLVFEGTWRTAVEISGGENNLVAGCTVRNTGQYALKIPGGWNHAVVGCDLYDLGEGGIHLADHNSYTLRNTSAAENRKKLIPNGFVVENNHIYRFNRLCGGNAAAIAIQGIGQRVSHNLINDSTHYGISIAHNNHVFEYNEIHDIVAHSRELGAVYTWDGGQSLTYRGNILRNNFIHHITGHSSPNASHGVRAVHIDGISSNLTLSGNVFFRTNGISSSAPDCRFENNIFVNCFPGISQGNRSDILEKDGKLNLWAYESLRSLKRVDFNQPPWSVRYPQLTGVMEKENRPLGWPRNVTIARNVSVGGPFATFAGGLLNYIKVENNMTEADPLFVNPETNDFRLRPGSPAYDIAGIEPVPLDKIGLYNDELRASWPAAREIGKYFDPSKETGIAKPKEYGVKRCTSQIKIDGKLEKNEWLGLDKSMAIMMDKHYTALQDEEGPKSYAWLLYDDTHLYIGIEHTPDPWTEEMPVTLKKFELVVTEISIEGHVKSDIRGWWLPDMATGPIYILWGYGDGRIRILDSYCKMPEDIKEELLKNIQYAAIMHDPENFHWTAEWKIPLSLLGINPGELEGRRFNIGVPRRKNWVAWMYTNGPIWRLEGGGYIKFVK